jgi:uncharacterized membrane protein
MEGGIEHVIFDLIEIAALAIEVLAVAIIVIAVLVGMVRYLGSMGRSRTLIDEHFASYRLVLGRALLLGLEILVAADIIKTVVLDPSVESVGVLGLLVLIRVFLGWSLIVEMEGRWPWQGEAKETSEG